LKRACSKPPTNIHETLCVAPALIDEAFRAPVIHDQVSAPTSSDVERPGVTLPPEIRNVGGNPRGWRGFVRPGVVLLLLIALGYFLWRHFAAGPPAAGTTSGSSGAQVVRVVTAAAHAGDIPVYISGLGAVTPLYTITITSILSGPLLEVYYTEGQMVQRGQLLAQIDPRPYQAMLTQAEGALARDQALLANARVDLDRYQTLWSHNAIQQQQVVTQEALVKQYEGDVQSDQGQIDTAKLDLQYCEIRSPITGRAGLRLVDPGNVVSANSTALVVITQVQPISVIFTISEDQLAPVREGMRRGRKFPVAALDRTDNHVLSQGALETIDNQIDPTTGTVKLRAAFENRDEMLFPQAFVNARLTLETKRGVTLVPNAAIQRSTNSTYVWQVSKDDTVHVRNVIVGAAGPLESQIVSGVSPGDVVVTEGVDMLRDGGKVSVQQNGAAPAGEDG
jgi:multidrug efflux system membrane fusion protein